MPSLPGPLPAPTSCLGARLDRGSISGEIELAEMGDHVLLLLGVQLRPGAGNSLAVAGDVGIVRFIGFAEHIHPEEQATRLDAPAGSLEKGALLRIAEVMDGEGGVEDVGLIEGGVSAVLGLCPAQ